MSTASRAALYWRTARHLRPRQIQARLGAKLAPLPTAGEPVPELRRWERPWAQPVGRDVGVLSADRFSYLNREETIAFPEGWNDPRLPKLWLYNLHYFDDLAAAAGGEHEQRCERLIERWIADNPPGCGDGWEPYPTSLRTVNWIKWALRPRELSEAARRSLAAQTHALERRIEWHLLANHLFANAKALVFAGAFFDGRDAARWLAKGLSILDREVPEQILADGGHIERSPMYHAIILEDLLDLLNLARAYPGTIAEPRIAVWRDAVARMRHWLAAMCHPDGDISFFNDCAFGVAPTLSELEAYATRLGLPSAAPVEELEDLAASGYVRTALGPFVLLVDASPVGPDYQPGHAHADTLSFELSVHGRRAIVNGGVSTYERDAVREAERATASHNTVEIGGESSSEVWAAFRVARRARVLERRVERRGDAIEISAAHDGYRRLPGRPIHRRTFRLSADGLTIRDEIDGGGRSAVARLRLHPDVYAEADAGGERGRISADGRPLLKWSATEPVAVAPTTQASAFNVRVATRELVAPLTRPEFSITLQPA